MEQPICSLSDREVEFIRMEVKKCGISFSHLEDELIDHICCLTEEYLNKGHSFEEAYKRVRKKVAFESLKEIEIQTLLLISKKLQAMKTTLKISGITGLSAILIASVLKVLHLPGAGVILTLGFLILTFGYLPVLAFALKKEKLLKRNRDLSYIGIIAAFSIFISLLFALMNWPYREYVIYISWIIVLIFLIMLFNRIMKSEDNRVLNLSLLLIFVILFILNITIYLLNLTNPKASHYTIENNLEASRLLFEQKINVRYQRLDSLQDYSSKKVVAELRRNTDEIVTQIEKMRNELFSNKIDQESFNRRIFKNYVITNKLEADAIQLEGKISKYRKYLITKVASNPNLKTFIEKSIQFYAYDFNTAPPIIYNNFEKLIRDIRISEFEVLNGIQ